MTEPSSSSSATSGATPALLEQFRRKTHFDLSEFATLPDDKAREMLGIALLAARKALDREESHGALVDQILNATIAELKQVKEELVITKAELEKTKTIDPLTGSKTRVGFEQDLARTLAEEQRLASGKGATASKGFVVIAGDMNNFKYINDTLGHPAGDKALIENAEIMQKSLRPGDTVARTGGDEFMLLLPHATLQELQPHLQALDDAIMSQVLIWGDHRVKFSCTLAPVFVSPDPEKEINIYSSVAEIYKAADDALLPKKEEQRAQRASMAAYTAQRAAAPTTAPGPAPA